MDNFEAENRYLIAKEKVEKLKGYYWHLASYIIVNIVISAIKIVSEMQNGVSFAETFFDFGTYALWFFWGIGMFFHTLGVFGNNLFLSKKWEQRKIKEILEKENRAQQKWL